MQIWGWRIGRCCLGWGGATASWTCWKWWGWTGQCAPVQAGTRCSIELGFWEIQDQKVQIQNKIQDIHGTI